VADEKNISDEEIGQSRIAALSKVNELNQKAWASAKVRREQIGVEYRVLFSINQRKQQTLSHGLLKDWQISTEEKLNSKN